MRHPPSPFRRRRFSNPLGLEPRALRLSWSRSLYRPFSSFSLVASPSSYIPHPRLAVSCFHVAQLPLRLCLSRPSRSPSLDPSLSQAIALLLAPHPPSSILPSHLPGFYLSLASTRSLSGNERRNTLATFNRPALSSAYTYLAGSVPPLPYPRLRPHLHPPPSCHPRPSSAHPRRAPTSRFLLLIFTTNIVYKYLRALSLVFCAFHHARLGRVFLFSRMINPKICERYRTILNRLTLDFSVD